MTVETDPVARVFDDLGPGWLGAPPAPDETLFEPGSTDRLTDYLRRLWDLRHFIFAEARGRLDATHRENILGRLWLFLEPATFVAVYFVLFGVLLDASRGLEDADFLAYLAIGKISFGYLRRGITTAAGSLAQDQALRAFVSIPRAVYPLSEVLRAALAYRAEIVVMVLFVAVRGVEPRLTWFLVPLFGVVAFGVCLGAGLILVRTISRFADLRSALPQLMILAMYSSGTIFPVEQYLLGREHDDIYLRVLALNPFYAVVKLNQWAIMDYRAPQLDWIAVSAMLWCTVLPVVGLIWFVRAERRYSSAIYAA